ncbi:MAG: glycosyltransferase [Candidatus Neomarinimicrobiota bacterium]
MTVSVIIVSYNVKEFLYQCIVSLIKSLQGISGEIIVVDNNSADGSDEMVRFKFPDFKLIANKENRGFAAACNQGMKITKGQYILLLNPDTLIQEDTITTMIDFFQSRDDVGAAGCKILNTDGSLQKACRRSFPTPMTAFPKIVGLSWLFPKVKWFGKYNLTYLDPEQLAEVDAVSGSFLMFRRAVWEKIGDLDETYFMYGEDLDFCYRIKQAGWKIFYVPFTKIIHYKGESAKSATFDNFITFYQAMNIFVKKNYRKRYSVFLGIPLRIGILIRGLISVIGRLIHKRIVMFVDGLLLCLSILIAHQLQPRPLPDYSTLISMLVFYLLLWLGTGYVIGLYDRRELSYSRAIVASVTSFVASILFNSVFRQLVYSPRMIVWSFIIVTLLLPGWRLMMIIFQRRNIIRPASSLSKALLSRRTIIAGCGEEGKRIAKKLQTHIEHGFEILGFVDKKFVHEKIAGFPFLGTMEDLKEILRIQKANEIIFTTDRFSNDDILNVIDDVKGSHVNVKIVPKNLDFILGKSSVEKIEDIPLIELDYNLYSFGNRLAKRLFDILFSTIGILLLTPFVFPYAWLRGYRLQKVAFLREEHRQFNALLFQKKRNNGSRIFIERFPLIFSIFYGDMSFVGNDLATANPTDRLFRCKPGLTGLSQLQGNHRPDEQDKQSYEHYYLQNHTLFLDLEIILKSLLNI